MLVGDARDALDEPAVDACAELHRRAVRAHRDEVAGRDAAAVGVAARQRDLAARAAGTGARARARPGGPRRAACSAAGGASRRSGLPVAACAWGARLPGGRRSLVRRARPGSAACSPSCASAGRRRSRSESSSKTTAGCGESSTPKRAASFDSHASSSGTGGITARRSRWTRPSRFIDVPSRSSAAVAGRTRSAQPTASEWNIVIAITASALLGERPDAGRAGRLVAGHDEQADRLGIGPRRSSAAAAHASETPRGVRGRGQVERGAAGLVRRSRARARPLRAVRRRRRRGPTRRALPARTRGAACRARARREELAKRVGRAAGRRRHRARARRP